MVANPHRHDDEDFEPDGISDAQFVTIEEGREIFDRRARMELGISGEEFVRRWDAGEYTPVPDTPEGRKIARLSMMLPIVGHSIS